MSDIPQMETSQPPARFFEERYLVRRKFFKILGAAFHIYDMNGNVVFYSTQKAFKLKEDIRVYTGEDMRQEVLTMKARQILDFGVTVDIVDAVNNTKVGALRRKALKSFIRDEWAILDNNDQEIGVIREDSVLLALVRRFLTALLPQRYQGEINGQPVCSFQQNWNFFIPKIELDFTMDPRRLLDRRLGIGAAVLLCAIEGRQN